MIRSDNKTLLREIRSDERRWLRELSKVFFNLCEVAEFSSQSCDMESSLKILCDALKILAIRSSCHL